MPVVPDFNALVKTGDTETAIADGAVVVVGAWAICVETEGTVAVMAAVDAWTGTEGAVYPPPPPPPITPPPLIAVTVAETEAEAADSEAPPEL